LLELAELKMPKHNSYMYTVLFKLSAIDWHGDNGSVITKTAKEFGVDRKRIREWIQNEDLLCMN
jgi:transposase-like protein